MSVQVQLNDKNQPVPVRVTHNNDRQHYVIAIDIAKEGGQLWDLTPYFKGRVGDSNFGLQVVWYYQGRLMDLTNKTPYIEGNVGEYSFDDNKEIQMAPDASVVSYTGDSSDCESGGRATYYFPEQMFPKSGAFKGFIGVRDDTGKTAHVSGVTIWFKVLPGAAQMGHACDFYVHDLEVALANANEKTREQLNDANTKLNNQLADANSSLQKSQDNFSKATSDALQQLRDKYKQEVQNNEDMSTKTRASLSELADTVGRIEAEIKAGDVVTLHDFNKQIQAIKDSQSNLSQQINDQLSKIQVQTKVYASLNDLEAAYPNGQDGLFMVMDTQHWYYWNGSQWEDGGAYKGTKFDFSRIYNNHFNILEGTSENNKQFNGKGWTNYTTSTNGSKLTELKAGKMYTYSAVVSGWTSGSNPYLIVQQYDSKGNRISQQTADAIDSKRAYTAFRISSDTDYVHIGVSFKNVSGDLMMDVRNEMLVAGRSDESWQPALNDLTLPDAITAIAEYQSNLKIDNALKGISGSINLLNNIPDDPQKVTGTGWLSTTTASNKYLYLTPGETYTYSATFSKVSTNPDLNPALKVNCVADDSTTTGFYKRVTHDGRFSLTFKFPENALFAQVTLSNWASVTDPLTYYVQGETLQKSDHDQGFTNSDTENEKLDLIYNQLNLNANELTRLFPQAFNLLVGTSNTYQQFTSTSNLDMTASQASNSSALKLVPGSTYTYAVDVTGIDYRAFAEAVFLDSNGNRIGIVQEPIHDARSGRRSITFTVPKNTVTTLVHLDFSDASGTYHASIKGEALTIGEYDYGWHKAASELTKAAALYQITSKDNYDLIDLENKLPFYNMLASTSDEPKSFTSSGWQYSSTAANNAFNLTPGETYTYAVDVVSADYKCYLEAVFYDANNHRSGQAQEAIHDARSGRRILTFTVPENTISTEVHVAFSQGDGEYHISLKDECLFHGNKDYGWSPNVLEMSIPSVLKVLANNVSANNVSSSTNSDPDINDGKVTGLPKLIIDGNSDGLLQSNQESVLPFTLIDHDRTITGYADMEWQGNSSTSLPKKGFKFKTFKDSTKTKKLKWQPGPTFYKSSNFHLKAYYTDLYNVNDAICAEIYSEFIANNDKAPKQLQEANHYGTIQSKPVLVYFGNDFYGLMEFCTKSSSDLWNIDEKDANQMAIEVNHNNDYGNFVKKGGVLKKDGDFELQSDNETNAENALEALQNKLIVDDNATFKANIAAAFDENSICDAVLFNWLVNNSDGWNGKNQVFITYDNGSHWFWMAYDFDSSLGSSWNPGTIYADDRDYFTDPAQLNNRVLRRWISLNADKLLARFNELESLGVLSIQHLQNIIRRKIKMISSGAFEQEWQRWPNNPVYQTDKLNVDHLCYMIAYRKRLLKQKLEAMQTKPISAALP